MGAAVALGNVIGKTQHRFRVAVVPLHGHVNANKLLVHLRLSAYREHIRMQGGFRAVNVFHEPFHATREGEVVFLAVTFVNQADFYTVIQERQFTQALGQNVVVVLHVLENGVVGQEVHPRTLLRSGAGYMQRLNPFATTKLHFMGFTVTPNA